MSINRNAVVALIGGALTPVSLTLSVPASADSAPGTTGSASDSGGDTSSAHEHTRAGIANSVGGGDADSADTDATHTPAAATAPRRGKPASSIGNGRNGTPTAPGIRANAPIKGVWNDIANVAGDVWGGISAGAEWAWGGISDGAEYAWEGIKDGGELWWDGITTLRPNPAVRPGPQPGTICSPAPSGSVCW